VRLVPVPAKELDEWLPRIEWHLASFCENGQLTPDRLIRDIRGRDRQLWIGLDEEVRAVALTEVLDDEFQSVHVSHCAGNGFREWFHLWLGIEAWARERGARRIETTCRPGWERPLKTLGLRRSHVLLEKRL
jgi:hypothetical protein